MSVPMPSLQAEDGDPFFEGFVFHYVINTADDAHIGDVAKSIRHHGGVISPHYDASAVTHVVLESSGDEDNETVFTRASRDNKRIVSWTWVEACIRARYVHIIDDSPLYVPPKSLKGCPDLSNVRVCVTGYTGERRNNLIHIVNLLGAEYMRVLDRKSTHLVCYEFEGAKWAKANQTKIQRIVSHKWLEECLRQWRLVPEAPYATLSGKEEDARDIEEAEIPDSEADDDDYGDGCDGEDNGMHAAPDGGPGNTTAAHLPQSRHSLGTFVTELTAGMAFAGGDHDEMTGMEAEGFVPAQDETAAPPATAPVMPSSCETHIGAQTQEATDALGIMTNHPPPSSADQAQIERGTRANATVASAAAGVLELAKGAGTMEPPPSRPPVVQRSTGGTQPTPKGSKLVDRSGADLMSPDWDELELRASQHIERSDRNRQMDPQLRAALAAGNEPPSDMFSFAGRIGSPSTVEAAFGGRFAERQPQRWHRFNDADAPLAADSFAAFLADIGAGTWAPDLEREDDERRGGWAARISSGASLFEVLTRRPAAVLIPSGVKITMLPRTTTCLAYLDRDDVEDDLVRWTALVREAAEKKERGPLGAAVISRLRLEAAKQPGQMALAGPNALLTTFMEVYLPFGFHMEHASLRGMLRPGTDENGYLRLREPSDIVTLPARVPGNLPGVVIEEVKRPLSEVVAGFHELLAGPTEPDMTQPSPRNRAFAMASQPTASKQWTAEMAARISMGACAPGSQAYVAATAGGILVADKDEDVDEDVAKPAVKTMSGGKGTSGRKKSATAAVAAAAAAAVLPMSNRNLGPELDQMGLAATGAQRDDEQAEDDITSSLDEDEVVALGAKGRGRKRNLIMSQDTGDGGSVRAHSVAAPTVDAVPEKPEQEQEEEEEEEEEEEVITAPVSKRKRYGRTAATPAAAASMAKTPSSAKHGSGRKTPTAKDTATNPVAVTPAATPVGSRRMRSAKTPQTPKGVETALVETSVEPVEEGDKEDEVLTRPSRSKKPSAKAAAITAGKGKSTPAKMPLAEKTAPPLARATGAGGSSKKAAAALPTKPGGAKGAKPKAPAAKPACLGSGPRPRVALSGFSSADLTRYGAMVTRIGGSVCAGHGWDPAATHVVFGPRGSRSLKFLAGAAARVPLLDASYLTASHRAGGFLGPESFSEHFWKGGRGADMGLVSSRAAEHWGLWNPHGGDEEGEPRTGVRRPFDGLTVALAPFASANRAERDMLATVLRAGGGQVASISAKGEVIPDSPAPDVAVVDLGSGQNGRGGGNDGAEAGVAAPALVGRAAAAVAVVNGGACVSPEFFKSWLSRPEDDLADHKVNGDLSATGSKLATALAMRGASSARGGTGVSTTATPEVEIEEEADTGEIEPPAEKGKAGPAAKAKAKNTAKKAKEAKGNKVKDGASGTGAADRAAEKGATKGRPKRASPTSDRPAQIVGKRRRVLATRN